MNNGKRILLRNIANDIVNLFMFSELYDGVDIAESLLQTEIFSTFLFGDPIYLLHDFISPERGRTSRPDFPILFWIQENVLSRTYDEFIDIFPELQRPEIRSALNPEYYNQIKGYISNRIDEWCFDNHYPNRPHFARKTTSDYKIYGSNIDEKEYYLFGKIWRAFYRHFGEKPSLSVIASACGYDEISRTSFSNSISSGSVQKMSIYHLENIIITLNSYIETDSASDISFYESVINDLEGYINYRRAILREYKRQSKYEFKYSKTQYNEEFEVAIDGEGNILRIPSDLFGFRRYLELVYSLDGGMPAEVQRLHRTLDLNYIKSISSFSKSPYTTKFDKKLYPKLYKIFNDDIILKGVSDLQKLQKLNKIAEYWREHQNEVPRGKWRTANPGGDHHEWVIPRTFKALDDMVVVSGLPVYYPDPLTGNLLTGHIDSVVIIGRNVYICDYKPDLNFDLRTDNVGSVFVDSVPQVATYGLIFKLMFGDIFGFNEENGYNLFCYSYHKDDDAGYIYRPETALKAYTEAYKILKKGEQIPWEFLLNIEDQQITKKYLEDYILNKIQSKLSQ